MSRSLILLTASLAFVSCASAKTLTKDDLRSDLSSAISLASETELFIAQIEDGRLLPQFQAGHADYLRKEAQREAKDLRRSQTDSRNGQTTTFCIAQLDSLAHELTLISRKRADQESFAAAAKRVEAVRKSLIAARAGL